MEIALTEHHQKFWSVGATCEDYAKQLIYKLHDSTKALLPQDWSLGVEMKSAIFIPLFLILARRSIIALLLIGSSLIFIFPTGYYYASFAIGVLFAKLFSESISEERRGWPLTMLGIVFYQIRWLYTYTDLLGSSWNEKTVWMLSSIGCGLILIGVLSSKKINSALKCSALVNLGRVSYSLYLVQVIVLMCLAPWIVKIAHYIGIEHVLLMQVIVLFLVSAVCLVIAHFGEKFIEVPCVRLGRIVTKKLRKISLLERFKI